MSTIGIVLVLVGLALMWIGGFITGIRVGARATRREDESELEAALDPRRCD